MKTRWLTSLALLMAGFAFTIGVSAQSKPISDSTREALIALMKSQDAFIPKVSPSPMKCYGLYATVAEGDEPRIRDLLINELGEFVRGKNTIEGACHGSDCKLDIHHAYGEDVSSLEIAFSTINGTADPASLECHMSP